jgi:hypothetical protein
MSEPCDLVEVDCPWFDPTWLLDHPDFPLAATLVVECRGSKEDNWE